jgi:hypothetical protein
MQQQQLGNQNRDSMSTNSSSSSSSSGRGRWTPPACSTSRLMPGRQLQLLHLASSPLELSLGWSITMCPSKAAL